MIPQFCTDELCFAWKPLKVEPVTVSQQLLFSFTNAEYRLPYFQHMWKESTLTFQRWLIQ